MKVVAFLPAKGTSNRIESKNMKLLDGKPLFLHSLEKLLNCKSIDEVYLDSESDEVFELASELNHSKLRRDPALADNKTDGHKLFYNEARQVSADIYIQILCTSPFIEIETIEKGINVLKNNKDYDSVVLIRKEKLYQWNIEGPQYDINNIPNSVDLDDTIIETMGLYIVRSEVALNDKKRIGKKPYLLEASAMEAVDVNYLEEFELAEYIMTGKRVRETNYFRNLSKILNSAVLSDTLDDLGLECLIEGLYLNLPNKKILGRAKTLKLRKLKDGEDFKGIYKALDSYNTIVSNDVILVENETSEYAYFGNLNANLSIRQGAIATIIGGKTRDFKDVASLDYPVFSTGYTSKDVRKRATTESINKEIKIKGIIISPGDLIFGDCDGIVVIPKKYEREVLLKAVQSINTENNIEHDILNGLDTDFIVEKNGEF